MDPRLIGEERSIEVHRRIAARMREEPWILEEARRVVEGWASGGKVHPFYVESWRQCLSAPEAELGAFLVEGSERARRLRKVSPFSHALEPRERWRLWREVRDRMEGR